MGDNADYLELAMLYEQKAENEPNPSVKDGYLRLAANYRRLAETEPLGPIEDKKEK